MKIEFSYGLLGYPLRYAGVVLMLALLVLFSSITYLIISLNYYVENPLEFIFLLFISVVMTFFCLKSAIYLFKYSKSFTNKYLLDDEGLTINPHKINSTIYLWRDLNQIIYIKSLKLFEIKFNKGPVIILMNNGGHET